MDRRAERERGGLLDRDGAPAKRLQPSAKDSARGTAFNSPCFHESVVLLDRPAAPVLKALEARGVLGGYNLTDESYPVAGTSSLSTASGYAEIIYARPPTVSLSATRNF